MPVPLTSSLKCLGRVTHSHPSLVTSQRSNSSWQGRGSDQSPAVPGTWNGAAAGQLPGAGLCTRPGDLWNARRENVRVQESFPSLWPQRGPGSANWIPCPKGNSYPHLSSSQLTWCNTVGSEISFPFTYDFASPAGMILTVPAELVMVLWRQGAHGYRDVRTDKEEKAIQIMLLEVFLQC